MPYHKQYFLLIKKNYAYHQATEARDKSAFNGGISDVSENSWQAPSTVADVLVGVTADLTHK